jgi:hypothetical protein
MHLFDSLAPFPDDVNSEGVSKEGKGGIKKEGDDERARKTPVVVPYPVWQESCPERTQSYNNDSKEANWGHVLQLGVPPEQNRWRLGRVVNSVEDGLDFLNEELDIDTLDQLLEAL